jgi:hypothetical protein
MSNNVKTSAKTIMDAYNANPETFITPDLVNSRKSNKRPIRWHTTSLVNPPNKKINLGISFKMVQTVANIKAPEERKYGVTIMYRRSSVGKGDSAQFGEALYQVYDRLGKFTDENLANKNIKVKKGKDNWLSTVQTELESGDLVDDPMIRIKLPFTDDGKPQFKLIQIDSVNGKNVARKVACNIDNIHTIIRAGTFTSGFIDMSTYTFSGYGISNPAKVQTLIIKPSANNAPEYDEILDEEDMMDMAVAPDDMAPANEVVDNVDNNDAGDDANDADDPEATTEEQLEALKALNMGGDE